MKINDPRYYNLQKTLTYNAEIYMIVGASGKGKTYTVRGYCLRQAINKGEMLVEICRTKTERDEVKSGYFDKLNLDPEFDRYEFDCRRNIFFYRDKAEGDKKAGQWKRCGYIVALSEVQSTKRRTFAGARWLIMDEAIMENIDRHHTYLRNEWDLLSRVINSCVREDGTTEEHVRPVLFLLGNAVDLLNPYFTLFGINKEPKEGYSWHGGKTLKMLLHYAPADEYDMQRRDNTLAGRMSKMTGYDKESFGNAFKIDNRYIAKKPPRAKPYLGLKFEGKTYGIWVDQSEGYYYICSKIPDDERITVFSLTRADDSPNMLAARASMAPLRAICDMYYYGACLFESVQVREDFLRAMSLFGIR